MHQAGDRVVATKGTVGGGPSQSAVRHVGGLRSESFVPSLRRPVLVGLPFILALGLAPIASSLTASSAASSLAIRTLSNRADLISGGDALTQVVLPAGVTPSGVHVQLNGVDVTRSFAMRPNHQFEGLLTGLRVGANTVLASTGVQTAKLTITNHPIGGPTFAGPQIQPWACQATAKDAQCNEPTTYAYYYMPRGMSG